jgi:phosphoribosylformylglycinamidine synthase
MGEACRALGIPVTGGNVSLYNEYPGGAIAPTPEIGVVGLLDDISLLVRPPFTTVGDNVVLVGQSTPGMAGSAYAALAGISSEDAPPGIELDREAALQSFIREAIGRGLVASAQDVSGGGLAVAVAECCMWSGLGAKLRLGVLGSPAIELFGESPSRLVLSCRPRHAPAIDLLARQFGLSGCASS